MFTIDGKGYFNKRNCVLETVKQYLKQHPETTSQQLQRVFLQMYRVDMVWCDP